jgi:pyrrolidone-carboxylate peptidase
MIDWILTGFEPWDDVTFNPSWPVAQAAAEVLSAQAILLPVAFDLVRTLDTTVSEHEPYVIHFGVAVKRTDVSIERYAHNVDPNGERLIDHAPVAFETSFPLRDLAEKIDAVESRDAGTFVCNATYFASLQRHRTRLFIHVPPFDDKAARAFGARLGHVLADFPDWEQRDAIND